MENPIAGLPESVKPGAADSPLSLAHCRSIDAYWRAANYLSVGQIYLSDNPLLSQPLRPEHVKSRLLGHWGTTPGLNFIYAHLNRAIKQYDLDMLFIAGPGHGGPALLANTWLEGSYNEFYPAVDQSLDGMKALFRQFSFPGGVPSHVAPTTPGSIHEGGELGYSIGHAYGAVFDNPDLIAACVVGDGEAETGPLAAAWHSNKFLNPVTDGAVLPILHLNGYKISSPTLLARIDPSELIQLFMGYGYTPVIVDVAAIEASTMKAMPVGAAMREAGVEHKARDQIHRIMASALDQAVNDIKNIQALARQTRTSSPTRPLWPMIILVSPKGWTGPAYVDGLKTAGFWRSHQVPLASVRQDPEHLAMLESWMRSYHAEELFDQTGRLVASLRRLAPTGLRRMGANPQANGGLLLQDLQLPDFRLYAVDVEVPGASRAEATAVLGNWLRDLLKLNAQRNNFRIFGPDETASNRLGAVFEATKRAWMATRLLEDESLAPDGRVMEILSEHTCQGWLEGYLLTGRHGLFSCYEAFIHIVDSMFNQHAKWLKSAAEVPWRRPIASLNYLLTSHVWRQDHNGFSHQDPGFIDHVVNKKADFIRVYLPPDANTLLWVTDRCLRSRNMINVIVAGKQPAPQWLNMQATLEHCQTGIGIWRWASNDRDSTPHVVMACAGDVPTLETLAAVDILRQLAPNLRIRVVNVVDLMTLQPAEEHPHGLSNLDFDALFTKHTPIIFAYHGYPWLIHRLTYRRTNHRNLHVRGYKEEGSTTTPFDMAVRNDLDRFHLVCDVADRVPALSGTAGYIKQEMRNRLVAHKSYINANGEDMPEVLNWQWPACD